MKAEKLNKKLRKELNDTEDEVATWKKRTKASEDESDKWKRRAVKAERVNKAYANTPDEYGNGVDADDDDETREEEPRTRIKSRKQSRTNNDVHLLTDDDEDYTNLVSKDDDDNSTLSSVRELKGGGSFRNKWGNMELDEPTQKPKKSPREVTISREDTDRFDDNSTVLAEKILKKYTKDTRRKKHSASDDNSTVAAEHILSNYLNMKGRFDTSSGRMEV